MNKLSSYPIATKFNAEIISLTTGHKKSVIILKKTKTRYIDDKGTVWTERADATENTLIESGINYYDSREILSIQGTTNDWN